MKFILIVAAVLGLSGTAFAQQSSAILKGQRADFAVTPPAASTAAGKDLAGSDKQALIARASRAKPSVVTAPDVADPTERPQP